MSRLNTTTDTTLMPKVVDSVLDDNVFATRMLNSAQKWPKSEKIKKSVKVTKNTQGTSFDGFDTLATAAVDTRITIEFEAKFYTIPVTVSLTELTKNKQASAIDLAAVELESSAEDMADDIGTIFYSDGTGNSSKDPLGLEAIVDDGTNVATYGGQSRTTYTTLNSTVTASGGTLSLAKMATLYSNCKSGNRKPTVAYTTETVADLYEKLLEPKLRINKNVGRSKGMESGTGFTGLDYKGFPVLSDEKANSGILYFINENVIEWAAMPLEQTNPVKFSVEIEDNNYTGNKAVTGLGFTWENWIRSQNQAAVTTHIYLGGQLWSKNPKRHGKLTGITSV